MKNIFLLTFVVAHFIYGLVFSLILLYASPDKVIYPLESSVYSLGSAFFILFAMLSVSFKKESNIFMKILFISYGIYFILCYGTLALITVYAPPNEQVDSAAMTIYMLAAGAVLVGVISIFKKEKERKIRSRYQHIIIAIIVLISGAFLGINVSYEANSILLGSYYFLATSIIVFLNIFFYPIDTHKNLKWLFYIPVILFSLLSFMMALVSLYSSPDNLVHPLSSALFFIASMVSSSSTLLDFKYLSIYENLNKGPLNTLLKILFLTVPILILIQNLYQRM